MIDIITPSWFANINNLILAFLQWRKTPRYTVVNGFSDAIIILYSSYETHNNVYFYFEIWCPA